MPDAPRIPPAIRPAGVEDAFSAPWNAPLYPRFPIEFRNVTIMTVFWRTTEAAIAEILPPPLRPTVPVVAAQIYSMPDVDGMGAVHECNVMVAAALGDPATVSGGFSTLLVLDSDGGVAHGREVHGQPKKLGSPSLVADGDLIVGRAARNGIDIITATMPYKQQRSSLDVMRGYFDFAENLNYKVLPNIDGTAAVRQITARRLKGINAHECWSGPCTVDLRPNAQAPVWRLAVVEPLAGFFWRADFTLEPGRIVHDYLKEARR
jgi:acetoacetate decarboxylase